MKNRDIERIKIWNYLFTYLLDHAIQCENKMCPCYASTFNDALADYREFADEDEKRMIQEIFDRK